LQYLAQSFRATLHCGERRASRAARKRDRVIGKLTDRIGRATAIKHGGSGTSTPHAATTSVLTCHLWRQAIEMAPKD
jgi:hypothetical protein